MMPFALLTLSSLASAGQLHDLVMDMPHSPSGFGAWNTENVEFIVDGGSFDEATGAYSLGAEGIYHAEVSDGSATVTARVHGKDWPVGEPPGIKVVHDDLDVKEGRPTQCLMTTSYLEGSYLDATTPEATLCSSPFQTHKRFKVAMLPGSLTAGGVDLVFNVSPSEATTDYQVFQKINNYTDQRLEGFELLIGVGVGADFKPASELGLEQSLWLSLPAELWDADQLATFSHGLFGPADKHFPEDGFFDSVPAGYSVALTEYEGQTGVGDRFGSTGTLGSNYAQFPPDVGPVEQLGPWLPSIWMPTGVFFDDDGDPATDPALLAVWGETSAGSGDYAWMQGDAQGFAPVPQETLDQWAADPLYFEDHVEDVLNLSLNYLLSVGTVDATWPSWDEAAQSATFTIRVVPIADTSGIGMPGYMDNPPDEIPDTDEPQDSDSGQDSTVPGDSGDDEPTGCGCSSNQVPPAGLAGFGGLLLGLMLLRRREQSAG